MERARQTHLKRKFAPTRLKTHKAHALNPLIQLQSLFIVHRASTSCGDTRCCLCFGAAWPWRLVPIRLEEEVSRRSPPLQRSERRPPASRAPYRSPKFSPEILRRPRDGTPPVARAHRSSIASNKTQWQPRWLGWKASCSRPRRGGSTLSPHRKQHLQSRQSWTDRVGGGSWQRGCCAV